MCQIADPAGASFYDYALRVLSKIAIGCERPRGGHLLGRSICLLFMYKLIQLLLM